MFLYLKPRPWERKKRKRKKNFFPFCVGVCMGVYMYVCICHTLNCHIIYKMCVHFSCPNFFRCIMHLSWIFSFHSSFIFVLCVFLFFFLKKRLLRWWGILDDDDDGWAFFDEDDLIKYLMKLSSWFDFVDDAYVLVCVCVKSILSL